jgi:hypothetical protein
MSKAARNRANRDTTPAVGSSGSTVFPSFPYERKFTREEIHGDILPRAKAFGDKMRDGVGPNGATLYIPGDLFELWMIHGVLAGADGGKAYIRARRLPDATGRLADAVEWVLLKDDTAEARKQDAEREADAMMAILNDSTRVRPEVAAIIRRRMRAAADAAAEYLADDPAAQAGRDDRNPDFGAPRLVQFKSDDADQEGDTTT